MSTKTPLNNPLIPNESSPDFATTRASGKFVNHQCTVVSTYLNFRFWMEVNKWLRGVKMPRRYPPLIKKIIHCIRGSGNRCFASSCGRFDANYKGSENCMKQPTVQLLKCTDVTSNNNLMLEMTFWIISYRPRQPFSFFCGPTILGGGSGCCFTSDCPRRRYWICCKMAMYFSAVLGCKIGPVISKFFIHLFPIPFA